MKNFIKFIWFTLNNGNFITLVSVITFAYLFGVSVDWMAKVGVTIGNMGFALITLLCTVAFAFIGSFLAIKDFDEFKDTEYRRRMECLINSGEWSKI